MAELTIDGGILTAEVANDGTVTLTLTQFGTVVDQASFAADVGAIATAFDLSPSDDGSTFRPTGYEPVQLIEDGDGGVWVIVGRTYEPFGLNRYYPTGYELVVQHFDASLDPLGDAAVIDYEADFVRYAFSGGDFYAALPQLQTVLAADGDLLIFAGSDPDYGPTDVLPLSTARVDSMSGAVLYDTAFDFALNPTAAALSVQGGTSVVTVHGGYSYITEFFDDPFSNALFFELDVTIDATTGAFLGISNHFNLGQPDAILGFFGDDRVAGDDGDNLIHGLAGNDGIPGQAGNDSLYGGEGDDTIAGGDGDDYLSGGGGSNRLAGGDGNDTIIAVGDDTIYAGPGADVVETRGPGALVRTGYGSDFVDGGTGDDTVFAGPGNDTLRGGRGEDRLAGGSGDDNIISQEGDDSVFGGAGNDTVQGRAGDDLVQGGFGNDVIVGDEGDDTLDAGPGNDTLTGGEGADVFEFNAAQPRQSNVIIDMRLFEDRISIAGVDGADDTARFDALEITDVTLASGGPAASVVIDNLTILVADVAAADLGAEDFLFV